MGHWHHRDDPLFIDIDESEKYIAIVSVCKSKYLIGNNTFKFIIIIIQGYHGIDQEVFLSLPTLTSSKGVTHVVFQNLNEQEIRQLRNSANTLSDLIKSVDF